MDSLKLDQLQGSPYLFSIAALILLLTAAFKLIKGLHDYYEDQHNKRLLNRINSIEPHTDQDPTTAAYLKKVKDYESFRLASGVDDSPEICDMLMKLYLNNYIPNSSLKKIYPYLKPVDDKIEIRTDFMDKFSFAYSLFGALAILVLAITYSVLLLISGFESLTPPSLLMAIILFTGFPFVGREYIAYKKLKRLRDKLIKDDLVINPDEKISWSLRSEKISTSLQ